MCICTAPVIPDAHVRGIMVAEKRDGHYHDSQGTFDYVHATFKSGLARINQM